MQLDKKMREGEGRSHVKGYMGSRLHPDFLDVLCRDGVYSDNILGEVLHSVTMYQLRLDTWKRSCQGFALLSLHAKPGSACAMQACWLAPHSRRSRSRHIIYHADDAAQIPTVRGTRMLSVA